MRERLRGVFDIDFWRVSEERVIVISDKTTHDPVIMASKKQPFHLSQTKIQSGLYISF
jgi:hypothetical protein